MGTKTRVLTAVAAGALTVGAFTVGAAAGDTTGSDVRQARDEMHAEMGGQMGAGMMSDDTWASMTAMHETIDPDVMQQMHDEMVQQLPRDQRAAAEAMHEEMFAATADAAREGHASHHPAGS